MPLMVYPEVLFHPMFSIKVAKSPPQPVNPEFEENITEREKVPS